MQIYHHVYWCELCEVMFSVYQKYADQLAVVCPVCNLEGGLEDLGYHETIELEEGHS